MTGKVREFYYRRPVGTLFLASNMLLVILVKFQDIHGYLSRLVLVKTFTNVDHIPGIQELCVTGHSGSTEADFLTGKLGNCLALQNLGSGKFSECTF